MKKAIVGSGVLAILMLTASLVAANEARDLPEAFIASIVQGKVSDAIDQFIVTNPVLAEKKQQFQAAKAQIEGAFQVFGQPIAAEVVAVDELSPSLRRFVFITKHPNAPLTWEFYVYKPKDSWIAASIMFNDNFSLTAPRK